VDIPAKIEGRPVIEITGEYAKGAFQGKGLTRVTIPESVTYIGEYAFQENNLTNVIIPEKVKHIGAFAFYKNKLTSINIPASVKILKNGAFAENNLTSVTISEGITTIDLNLFFMNQLTSVTIPSTVTEIGGGAFKNNKLTSVTIPASVISIGKEAFSYNQLTSVIIPENVTTIEDGTFRDNKLTSVIIPKNVTSIVGNPFKNNPLSSISVVENSNYSVRDGVLFNKDGKTLIIYPPSKGNKYTIPEGVVSISEGAFSGAGLTSITIPSSITKIGYKAFENNNITTITINEGIKSVVVELDDFFYCSSFFSRDHSGFYAKNSGTYEKRNNQWFSNGKVLPLMVKINRRLDNVGSIKCEMDIKINGIDWFDSLSYFPPGNYNIEGEIEYDFTYEDTQYHETIISPGWVRRTKTTSTKGSILSYPFKLNQTIENGGICTIIWDGKNYTTKITYEKQ